MYFYILLDPKNDEWSQPSIQQLFEQSFLPSNIKFVEIPSCFIFQVPLGLYDGILPSKKLDMTDFIIENLSANRVSKELFAILLFKNGHCEALAKAGSTVEAPW